MIATATTGTGFKGVISYVQKEHEKYLEKNELPEILEKNNIYGDTKKMSSQMRFISKGNSRVSRPVLHVAISFHKEEKLSKEQTERALNSVLKEIGVNKENNQYFLVKHNDAKHEHYHVVINKVGFDAKTIDTSYIKNKLQVICDKIEQEQGLRRTDGRTILYDPSNKKGYRFLTKEEKSIILEKKVKSNIREKKINVAEEKNHVKTKILEALNDKNIDTADKFKTALEKESIQTKFMENKNGISGVSFRYQNQAYKGTDLGYKWSKISKELQENKTQLMNNHSTFTLKEQKEIMYTKEYNKAIENVVNQHKEEYKKENLAPDTDRIFKENGFKKEDDKYIFEKYGHRQEVDKKAFDLTTKQVQEKHSKFEKDVEKYNTLMNTQPKKEPLLFGKEKVVEENLKLHREKKEAVKPEFKIDNNVLDSRTYQISSKSIKDKLNDMNKENFKSAIEKGKRNDKDLGIKF